MTYLTLIEKGFRAAEIVHILDSFFFTFRPAAAGICMHLKAQINENNLDVTNENMPNVMSNNISATQYCKLPTTLQH